MIEKLRDLSPSDYAATRVFEEKLEPTLKDPDREFIPRPPKRSRAEIERLTTELFERLEREKRAAGGAL